MTSDKNNVHVDALQAGRIQRLPAWLSLLEAVRLVIALDPDGQQHADCVSQSSLSYEFKFAAQVLDKWVRAELPESAWWLLPSEPEPSADAMMAIARAKGRLKRVLQGGGKIRGRGLHHDQRRRLPISDEAWSTYKIDFAANALTPHDRHDKSFPKITGISVSRDDLIAAFEAKGKAAEQPKAPQAESDSADSRKPFPAERFPELCEFLSKLQPQNDNEAWEAAEEHFGAKITREMIREARKAIDSKGKVGRRRKNSAIHR
jgi:hypothetical protein